MKKALTAIQPSGFLHLGNYIGAIEPAVKLQTETKLTMFIADYHAITVPQKPEDLRRNILFAAATYLACGINPNRTTLFQQSRVPAHTELAWVLQCVARMGEVERMIQYKDKAVGKGESVSVGLFTYPILMAADILLYNTEIVPVGEDQKQHVELARDLAERFNKQFGDTFLIPEPQIRKDGARIMGLDDATKKMSKSATSAKNYISLTDEPDVVRKKIMTAVTDSSTEIRTDRNRPAITNLLTIFSAVTGRPIEAIEIAYLGKGYGEFKKDLAEAIVEYLTPLQAKLSLLLADETELKRILDDGAARANEVAEHKIRHVRKVIGAKL
ncbi:tryptophan--tRNA ligase [Candidatus Uhrbacteria bacterium RIFOXYB12_FULL_58_10]|uniref:Tryptophan--tRNA ligase n=1 Tax=Candidatus Uhrbacteria bacterium RIFOXYB2_FULL_57_15 TaxID=1802422 RepID=A0A1F7W847_9BACT|nr:MAG: tryptophan--tRNA ligase [Candidatus Uhrbacteria bacterium RIFOXYB12_FULL_58_10]OGL98548.1 MAG: tryptophan--tRNA ligase [Candidatus Uhrbacteria bacterium RIFOXYB2_FULL_57_15]OGM00601.1 MAG: tryptophan--tRNA ligase [Candidatus Uhrbacteria bacterium RIFOXYC12_FULL_57_11]